MKSANPIQLIIAHKSQLDSLRFEMPTDTVFLAHEGEDSKTIIVLPDKEGVKCISNQIKKYPIANIAFISRQDSFKGDELRKVLKVIFEKKSASGLTLLLPYKAPPRRDCREDGTAMSFTFSADQLDPLIVDKYLADFSRLAYYFTYHYLNSSHSNNLEIIQVGKPAKAPEFYQGCNEHLMNSLLIIPHKGSPRLLERCLFHLNGSDALPGRINICFDDNSYKKIDRKHYGNLYPVSKIFKNKPAHVGPYLARDRSVSTSDRDFIFFQDSDDISVKSRFSKQIHELSNRNLDMIGSHELRIDQIARRIFVRRFPADVNYSLAKMCFHSLFHPTSLITKNAYLKTGGFSTDLRFGYDSQFLLRSFFHLKIGNMDDFLYIRFKRPNSLTTHPKTKIGGDQRKFLLWRWNTDFKLILENKLDLADSSLQVKRHTFNYQLSLVE